jgi:2,5-diamino-6-(ribosylamino)-4(3H)-pyrimidinone 5'-phosphate reductase
VVAVLAEATPPRPAGRDVPEIVAGTDRVDSGGSLIGALLGRGLLDKISLLVHPVLAGERGTRRWHGDGPPPAGGGPDRE